MFRPKVVIDLLVETSDPLILDRFLSNCAIIQARVVTDEDDTYERAGLDLYRVRCFSDPEFVTFAITQQGYGCVVNQERVV